LGIQAQDVTVVHDYGGKKQVDDPENYRMVASTEHTVVVYRYERIPQEAQSRLISVILQNLDYYLDEILVDELDRMRLRKTERQVLRDMQGIVDFNIQLYDYQVDEEFKGFSAALESKLSDIAQLDWSGMRDNPELDSKAFAQNYVQARLAELRQMTEEELLAYAQVHVHEFKDQETMDSDNPWLADVDTGAFQKNSLLKGIDFHLERMDVEELPLFIEPEVEYAEVPSGTDERIVQLLESNNQMMSMFQEQMLSLQREMVEIKREGLSYQQQFAEIKEEIQDLQVSISEVKQSNQDIGDGPLRAIDEEAMTIRFDKNSIALDVDSKMKLNEVYLQLMTQGAQRVMITGFADKSGNPSLNAEVSKMRADSVRAYLMSKGIRASRLIVNHVGDALSKSENATDRKVEIAWLTE
jgi:outer membrane protein OmpA-like peptidoglycan-associated protein